MFAEANHSEQASRTTDCQFAILRCGGSGGRTVGRSRLHLFKCVYMRLISHVAAAVVYLITAQYALGQSSQIYLDTTGDFGLDDNWSDPTKAPPEMATATHVGYIYYINGNRTA